MKVYGLYPGFPDFGIDDSCHPDDLAQIKNFSPHGKVFQSDLEEMLGYIKIAHGLECFRVQRNQFRQIDDALMFSVGDHVITKSGKTGTIWQIEWHFERKQPYFLLLVECKKKQTWYFKDDLRLKHQV
jgi:preprotein translocase subunit YajC